MVWIGRRRERGIVPVEPEPWPDPVPVEPESTYVTLPCPDPECGVMSEVWGQYSTANYLIPVHFRNNSEAAVDPRCWLSGVHIADAQAIIDMREADGGRLKTAAHP